MTTPKEDLILKLRGQAYTTCRPDQLCDQAADLLQSQAGRIAMLESLNELAVKQAETLVKQRDALRAELDALRGQEPVIDFTVLHQFAEQQAISYNKLCTAVHLAAAAQPAQDVTELVEALEALIESTTGVDQVSVVNDARTALSKYKGAK